MYRQQRLILQQSKDLRNKIVNPLVGLSPLELELLLDQILVGDNVQRNVDLEKDTSLEGENNSFAYSSFDTSSVKGKISRKQYLETPQVFVEKGEEGYSTKYNPTIDERISEKLAQLKETEQDKMALKISKARLWIVEQQLAIVRYICETQDRYLQTRNPLDLESLSQQDIADHIEYSLTTVNRLIKNVSVQLPDGQIIFADELIPGATITTQKGIYALRQLMEDPMIYGDGEWKVPDSGLVPILRDRFGIKAVRRTVAKYRGRLTHQ